MNAYGSFVRNICMWMWMCACVHLPEGIHKVWVRYPFGYVLSLKFIIAYWLLSFRFSSRSFIVVAVVSFFSQYFSFSVKNKRMHGCCCNFVLIKIWKPKNRKLLILFVCMRYVCVFMFQFWKWKKIGKLIDKIGSEWRKCNGMHAMWVTERVKQIHQFNKNKNHNFTLNHSNFMNVDKLNYEFTTHSICFYLFCVAFDGCALI